MSPNEDLSALDSVVTEYEKEIETGELSVTKLVAHIDAGGTDAQIMARGEESNAMLQGKIERVNIVYLKSIKEQYPNDPSVEKLIRRAANCFLKLIDIWASMSEELVPPEAKPQVRAQLQNALSGMKKMVALVVGQP